MANDIDMWNDIDKLELSKSTIDNQKGMLLHMCYFHKFIEVDLELAEQDKELFIKRYGYWGKYW